MERGQGATAVVLVQVVLGSVHLSRPVEVRLRVVGDFAVAASGGRLAEVVVLAGVVLVLVLPVPPVSGTA